MMARGEVALIVTATAMDSALGDHALPPEFMIMTVLLILVSSILTPIFLKLLYKDKKPPQGGEAVLSEGEPVQADDEIGANAAEAETPASATLPAESHAEN